MRGPDLALVEDSIQEWESRAVRHIAWLRSHVDIERKAAMAYEGRMRELCEKAASRWEELADIASLRFEADRRNLIKMMYGDISIESLSIDG